MKTVYNILYKFSLKPYVDLWSDVRTAIDKVMLNNELSPNKIWFLSMIGLLLTWFIYVPIHELLHVAGCIVTGGTVSELRMDPLYGANILNKIFPFIVPTSESEYAGRLTGFSTNGSDFVYFATVFCPFIITIAFGALSIRIARIRRNSLILGGSLVIAGAPFMSLTGDFLEMGSIIGTRLFSAWELQHIYRFRSDDLFRLFLEMYQDPLIFGLNSVTGCFLAAILVILSLLIGGLFAGWTYALSRQVAEIFIAEDDMELE